MSRRPASRISGSATIDNTAENTFLHAWNVRVNSNQDGTSILTADKIPVVFRATLRDPSGFFAAQKFALADKDILYHNIRCAAET